MLHGPQLRTNVFACTADIVAAFLSDRFRSFRCIDTYAINACQNFKYKCVATTYRKMYQLKGKSRTSVTNDFVQQMAWQLS